MPESIKAWPESERPRESLLKRGASSLSDAALIAILLRSGLPGEDAVAMARRLLREFGSLTALLRAGPEKLQSIKGLGPAKVAILVAVTEIAERHAREEVLRGPQIRSARDIGDHLVREFKGLPYEVFRVVYLDQAQRIIAMENLSQGSLNHATVYPREVVKKALQLDAVSLIFAHNHPSDQSEPSPEDIQLTRRLFAACRAVDLHPLDHLIVTSRGYLSLKPYLELKTSS